MKLNLYDIIDQETDGKKSWFHYKYQEDKFMTFYNGVFAFWKVMDDQRLSNIGWFELSELNDYLFSDTAECRSEKVHLEDIVLEEIDRKNINKEIVDAYRQLRIIGNHDSENPNTTYYKAKKSGEYLKRFQIYLNNQKYKQLMSVIKDKSLKRNTLITGLIETYLVENMKR